MTIPHCSRVCITAVFFACATFFTNHAHSELTSDSRSTHGYAVTKTVASGAPDHWDFVAFDPVSGKVFIAHGDRITVVDGSSGQLIGNVEGLPGGTHGVAIVPGQRGYTDDGRAGTVASFDLDKLKLINTIKADADADAVVFDPISGHVFVVDSDPGKLTVVGFRSQFGCRDRRLWRQT